MSERPARWRVAPQYQLGGLIAVMEGDGPYIVCWAGPGSADRVVSQHSALVDLWERGWMGEQGRRLIAAALGIAPPTEATS